MCSIRLTLRNYYSIDGILYCAPHATENRPQQAKSTNAYFISPLKLDDSLSKNVFLFFFLFLLFIILYHSQSLLFH